MTAKTIMTSDLVVVKPTDKVSDALTLMHEHNLHDLPVVDEQGSFVGMFGRRRFMQALLPMAAQDKYGLSDLSFLPDREKNLNKHLKRVGDDPVSKYLEKKKYLTFCKPSTPFPKLLQMLCESSTSMPVVVVKGKEKKLVGMVSTWDVLDKLAMAFYSEGKQETEDTSETEGTQESEDAPNAKASLDETQDSLSSSGTEEIPDAR